MASSNKEKLKVKEEDDNTFLMKASELPIYEKPVDLNVYEYHGKEKSMLEEGISIVRKELESTLVKTKSARDNVFQIYHTGKAHSSTTLEYLREEENLSARAGAITAGGLLGLLFATRRGIFKKLIFTSAGAGGTASICYPNKAFELSQDMVNNAGDYAAIGYNFVIGVKPLVKDDVKRPEIKKSSLPISIPSSSGSTTALSLGSEVRNQYSLDVLAQQASDVTYWGFRLKHYMINNHLKGNSENINKHEIANVEPQESVTQQENHHDATSVVKRTKSSVTSSLQNTSEFSEKEKVSDEIEVASEWADNAAHLTHEQPVIENITKNLEVIAEDINSFASVLNTGSKMVNNKDKVLIIVPENMENGAEEVIQNEMKEIIDIEKDLVVQKKSKEAVPHSKLDVAKHLANKDINISPNFLNSNIPINSDVNFQVATILEPSTELKNKVYKHDSHLLGISSLTQTEETDSNSLSTIPIVIVPESQIVYDNNQSNIDNYETRLDRIEMLEDVFIDAMLRMQKQEQINNIGGLQFKNDIQNELKKSSTMISKSKENLMEKKDNKETNYSSQSSMPIQPISVAPLAVSVNQVEKQTLEQRGIAPTVLLETEPIAPKTSITKAGDLNFVESPGYQFKIPSEADAELANAHQFMDAKTESSEKNGKQSMKIAKDIILKLETPFKKKVEGDLGQSNPEDNDMYTTRS